MKPRHAVDLDGTAAVYDGQPWIDFKPDKIGDPVPLMADRVRRWLAKGDEVVILTARMHPSNGDEIALFRPAFEEWSQKHFGTVLEVTCEKDPRMVDIWDDKAVHILKDTGVISDGSDVDDPLLDAEEESPDSVGEFLSE